MESSGLSGGLMSGMLGLEIPLHHPQHSSNPHRQHQQQQLYQNHQHQFMPFTTTNEADHQNTQSQLSLKPNVYPNPNPSTLKGKQQQVVLSDEEGELGGAAAEDGGGGDGRKRVSPWQRVKWTDSMIRLLIMVVFYIEDDCGGGGGQEGNESLGNCKKKSGGILQKKGKWKSVSRAMMDKGFFVSPQQCEDKFNDLNKRYKRVNEILGKGTACRVVENQSLLDSMDQLSPKMKDEVRKLLNSKHLFFREMCAYHNSGGGGGGGGGAYQSSEVGLEPSSQYQSQQRCFHSTNGAGVSNLRRVERDGLRGGAKGRSRGEDDEDGENDDDDDDEDDDDEDDDEDDDDGDEVHCAGAGGGRFGNEHSGGHEDEDENEKLLANKRRRTGMCSSSSSPLLRQLSSDLMNFLQDGTKSPMEQRQWMRNRWLQVEEQQVSCQLQAYELEKQRLKWLKFSGKKEREMERMKLNNERRKLENERMVLLLRQKELELLDIQRQHQDSSKRPEPSSVTG